MVENSNKDNLKVIKDTFSNKSGNLERLKKITIAVGKLFNEYVHSQRGFAEGVLQVILFKVFCFK